MNGIKKFVIFGTLVVTVTLLLLVAIPSQVAANSPFQTSFINVGQGDSALVSDESGFDILIDGGRQSAGPTVVAYLHEQGIDDIDVMIASHADSDHIGGLITVLQSDIPIEKVVYNGYPGSTDTWSAFAAAVAARGLSLDSLQYPQELVWGSSTVYILNPPAGLLNPESNSVTIVMRLVHGQTELLFTGDIESSTELSILARETPVSADILKVAHHGSKYSSSDVFLAAVHPEEAVISVGINSYGHPAPETINRLLAAGARIWRTDESGTIVFYEAPNITYVIYLPLVIRSQPTPTFTPTPTSTSTQTPTSIPFTATPVIIPTATATQGPAVTGNVSIINIFFDGAGSSEPDEYVEIRNDDVRPIQLQNWTLSDIANHVYTFPSFVIQPSQVCRVYTNQNHPEYCSFNYGSGSSIWNNTGDTAYLRDTVGTLIDTYSY